MLSSLPWPLTDGQVEEFIATFPTQEHFGTIVEKAEEVFSGKLAQSSG